VVIDYPSGECSASGGGSAATRSIYSTTVQSSALDRDAHIAVVGKAD